MRERASHLVGLAGNVEDAVVQGGGSRCEDGADEVGAEGEEEESDTPARTPTGLVVGHEGRDRRLCVGATSTVSVTRGARSIARGGGSARSAAAGELPGERASGFDVSLASSVSLFSPGRERRGRSISRPARELPSRLEAEARDELQTAIRKIQTA